MTDARLRTLQKICVYGWVSVFNMLVVVSLWFVSPYGYSPGTAVTILPMPPANTTPNQNVIHGDPVHIRITDLNISLNVLPGQYNQATQTWDISPQNAHFATISTPANTSTGNTLLYGHNNKQVFYNIRNISPGATAIITTANGYTFTYQFAISQNVAPTDLSVFRYDGAPTLTIQTCTGNWNETRGLFLFTLKGVKKA